MTCLYSSCYTAPYKPMTMRPADSPPMSMSKNTFLLIAGAAAAATCTDVVVYMSARFLLVHQQLLYAVPCNCISVYRIHGVFGHAPLARH